MKQTIYISLPITGHDLDAVIRRARLMKANAQRFHPGAEVFTPFDVCPEPAATYGHYIGRDLEFIIDRADAVLFASDWDTSRGCRMEHHAAFIYGKHIIIDTVP